MFQYREILPSRALRSFVHRFWILENESLEHAAPQRVVPDGRSELILNWESPFEAFGAGEWQGQPRCFLAGQIDGPLLLKPKGPTKMLGIRFHPHGVAMLFGEPMYELNGRFTPLEDLSPELVRNLNQALGSPDPISMVEAALLSASSGTLGGDELVAEAVRRIGYARGASDIAALGRELGVSTRQLERRFQRAVGLAPKLFSRIQRFSNVFRLLQEGTGNWVETALACGYYDQAHLIRDCKRFSGITLALLLAEDGDLARHFYLRFGMSHSSKTAPYDEV